MNSLQIWDPVFHTFVSSALKVGCSVLPRGIISGTLLTFLSYTLVLPFPQRKKKREKFLEILHCPLRPHLDCLCRGREAKVEKETKEIKIWALKYLRLQSRQCKVFFPRLNLIICNFVFSLTAELPSKVGCLCTSFRNVCEIQ